MADRINTALIVLAILLMVGNNYAFDIPQALEIPLEKQFHLTQTKFNLLYSVFAVPNIGLSIGGGIMIDNIGGRWGILTFSFMLALSQLAIAFGGCYQKYYMMLVGRAIFGIASDMLHIAVFKVVAKRMPNNIGTAMGLILTIPELAAALNSFLTPWLFEITKSITAPLLLALTLCFLSFFCGLLMVYIDQKYESKEVIEEIEESSQFEFSKPFVLMALICTLMQSAYVPFLDNANKYYQQRFGWKSSQSGTVVTIGYIVAAISSPLVGKISDTFKSRKLVVISTLMFLISHLQFYGLPKTVEPNYYSIFGFITLGLSYACYSSILMPALQATVPESMLATALGIMGVAENICLTIVPLLSGYVYGLKGSDPMKSVDMIYIALATMGFLLSLSFAMKSQQKLKQ